MVATAEKLTALTNPVTYDQLRKPREYVTPAEELRVREQNGGRIVRTSQTVLRWYPADVETAMARADLGDLSMAAQLWRATWTDGRIRGVLGTRTSGLVRLPKTFSGDQNLIAKLRGAVGSKSRSQFDLLLPPSELAMINADAIGLGIGVGEFLPVQGRTYPKLCRLSPEFLRYNRSENRWYYLSAAGPLLITPGDGRWVLHQPGGHINPWQYGIWAAVATAWIDKVHASNFDYNWQSKLANPARVAHVPNGAVEEVAEGFFEAVMAWGLNTVIQMPAGFEADLLESNGVGHEAFKDTKHDANDDAVVAVTGQLVTTDGGAGFQNANMFDLIRKDLIQDDADGLAYTANTQALPHWACWTGYTGEDYAQCAWDTTSPKERADKSKAASEAAKSVKEIDEAFAKHGYRARALEIAIEAGVPVEEIPQAERDAWMKAQAPAPKKELADGQKV